MGDNNTRKHVINIHKDLTPRFYLRSGDKAVEVDYLINGLDPSEIDYNELEPTNDNYEYELTTDESMLRGFPLSVSLKHLHKVKDLDLVETIDLVPSYEFGLSEEHIENLLRGIKLVNSGKVPNASKLRIIDTFTSEEIDTICNLDLSGFTDIKIEMIDEISIPLLNHICSTVTNLNSLQVLLCTLTICESVMDKCKLGNVVVDNLICKFNHLNPIFLFIKLSNVVRLNLGNSVHIDAYKYLGLLNEVAEVVCFANYANSFKERGVNVVAVNCDNSSNLEQSDYESVNYITSYLNSSVSLTNPSVTNFLFDKMTGSDEIFSSNRNINHTIAIAGKLREAVYKLSGYRRNLCDTHHELVIRFDNKAKSARK